MAKRTITLALDGDVTLDDFVKAMENFQRLVSSLTEEVAPGTEVRWVVDYLEAGSAEAAVRGEVTDDEDVSQVEAVVDAWDLIGRTAEAQQPFPYSARVAADFEQLTAMLANGIEAIQFCTEEGGPFVLTAPLDISALPPLTVLPEYRESFGAVTGRIETLAHRSMRFAVYDLLDDKRIDCFLVSGQEELVKDLWGQLATVEGRVRREFRSGRPRSVRGITSVRAFDEPQPGAWRRSAGIAPAPDDAAAPEDTIRRMRDDD